jgi:hypothetical protein
LGLGIWWCAGPRVGLRAAVHPWAGGRNPVGIGGLVVRRTQGRPAAQSNPGLGGAIPLGLGIWWCGGPRVGLRAAVQPWARGRNPVGIGVTGKMPVPLCLLRGGC